MFAGIRRLMAVPFARPPGRRGLLARFAPEWCALTVYVLLFLPVPTHLLAGQGGFTGQNLLGGATLAYALAGLIFLIGPTVAGALAWARERDQDTLDSLVLTPVDREALVRGRFWRVMLPWLRFCAYLLPIYLLLSTNELFRDTHERSEQWLVSNVCALGSNLLLGLVPPAWSDIVNGPNQPHLWTTALALLRFANELSIPLFACGLAFFISARCRSAGRALLWSCLLTPTGLLTIFDIHDWLLLLVIWGIIPMEGHGSDYVLVCSAYLLLGLVAFVARVWLTFWLVRRAARNFDAHALGEAPERS